MSPFPLSRVPVRALILTAICAACVIAALVWNRQPRAASTIVVNSTSDVVNASDGLCTLREAITAANTDSVSGPAVGECNAGSGDDMISFSVTGTITLGSVLDDISTNISITGPGISQLTISGSSSRRVFQINSGAIVNVSDMTIADGSSACCGEINGGAINNKGTLTLTRVNLSGNSTIAGGNGGAIYNNAHLTLTECSLTNNYANTGRGGAITTEISGAGLSVIGDLTINHSLIANNTSDFGGTGGGGIAIRGGTVTINNTTISGNNAGGQGGGILDEGSNFTATNLTITNNRASVGFTGLTGGGFMLTGGGTNNISNSIIAGNFRGASPSTTADDIDAASFTVQGSFNIVGVGSIQGSNNQFGNPRLGPLANNGGPTQTHALLAGSPALDAGSNTLATNAGLTTDQRGVGFGRTVDGPDADTTDTADIGAFEAQVSTEDVVDKSTNEDTQLQFNFNLGGAGAITSVTATSSNTALVPNDVANIALTGSGSTRTLTINPVANKSGTSTITVTASGNGQSMSDTFVLTVNSANDAPSFTKGGDQTVAEDAGAQTVAGWATAISPGPPEETGQTVSFLVTNNNNSLFSVQPAVSPTGTLTYTPAANANGVATVSLSAKDDGGTANGGVDTSASQTFTITVNAINDAPSFTKGADQTVNEDASAQTVNGWATGISAGAANESGQTLTFTVTNDNAGLFSAQPALALTGTLTYTPAANANGTATVSVTLKDNGGTANGGNDTSATQTFTITVNAVNDAPSFTKGPNLTVNEDAPAQTILLWSTPISAGPANESSQIVTLTVTNNNNGLFSSQPALALNGTLTYTPAANANGSATVTVTAKDDGGTANGGNDTSSQTFTITVSSVNDAPSFTKGADQTVNNNAGAQSVTGWATGISAGASNESSQILTFQLTNPNPGLFTAGPAISSTGTLSYTPSSSSGGTATITVTLKDSGGVANGGVDTSTSQTFTITVTPVGGFVNFATSTANTTENSGSTTVNVVRTGDTSKAVAVNYATNADSGVPCSTANGVASPKCDFTAALGTLSFAAGETSKPITILISQDSFVEGPETITVTLSSPTAGAALATPSSMTVAIADDATEPPTNVIDDANMFVRMHYHDFLNREADQSGLDFWTGQMTNCGNSDLTVCRINVSGAFFLSIEFQQTGYLVERIYKTGYGDAQGTSQIGGSHQIFVPIVRANEFLADTQRVGRGVVVGQTGWETVLENNKQAYALEFVQTSRFITAFPTTMTPAQFVDQLNTNAGGVLSVSERQTVINLFGNSVNTTNVTARAQALRQVAEDADLFNAEANRAFVLTQYIGYLRRNPNDAPDSDYSGYDFWLGKLIQFNGNYVAAEMVKAFISSDEYRHRFGP